MLSADEITTAAERLIARRRVDDAGEGKQASPPDDGDRARRAGHAR